MISNTQALDDPTLLHSTRYSAGHEPFIRKRSIHRDIFRYAYAGKTDLLLQSEPEEISMITDAAEKPSIDRDMTLAMLKLYGATDWQSLEAFITRHTRVFFDIASWANGIADYGKCFGTRLHATVMALNSGVPAILVHHDSRTREMAEFAGIPAISTRQASVGDTEISSLFAKADFSAYFATRRRNQAAYAAFLADNGIEPALARSA